jgi:hypothetical protein
MKIFLRAAAIFFALIFFTFNSFALVDSIAFGDNPSEKKHRLTSVHSEVIVGAFGEPARRLLPLATQSWGTRRQLLRTIYSWQGGTLKFTVKVDPDKLNYATIKLWGSDATQNLLILFCDGKQIGYRYLGDMDVLDTGGDDGAAFPGRFCFNTTPLPLELTQGKTNLTMEIRSAGPIWGYGNTFKSFQTPMTMPTRGFYKLYIHTDAFFIPPADEKQGCAPTNPPVRQKPGPEVLEKVKERVNGELKKLIKSKAPLNQMQMQFIARAYHVKWTVAYQNPVAVKKLLRGLDAVFAAYCKKPSLAEADPATYNAAWFGLGPSGDVLRLMADELNPFLDFEVDDGARGKISRRAAFSEMLVACRDWHRRNRRLYTNQSMINDLYGIYLANCGVEVVDPAKALPEKEVRRYLYESIGLEPWRDSDPGGGIAAETGRRNWGAGTNYWELTAKGLSKELGYVGYYGEMLDWVTAIYDATRPALNQPGDEKIRAQLIRMGHARAIFRYPALDTGTNRAMRVEAVVGWRDGSHYPGDIAYAQRMSWDGSALGYVAATLDPVSIGYVQQMFADNQFFATLQDHMKQYPTFRVTAGLLAVPDEYTLLKSQPPQVSRLPMTPGQPDFVFSDEEDGVVAIKNGDEIFYASLYWRARYGINNLARVHFTTPQIDRIAVVHEETAFTPSGQFYIRPDWIAADLLDGGPKYPVKIHSALEGERLPIAKIPAGVPFKPGDENAHAGKGDFYTLRYGDYLIGMNMTTDRTFELSPPPGVAEARELVSKTILKLNAPIKVAPRSTVVLSLGK